jgi:heme-binding protein
VNSNFSLTSNSVGPVREDTFRGRETNRTHGPKQRSDSMTRAVTIKRAAFAALAAGALGAAVALPAASAEPTPADDCSAAALATTISSVTASLSTYFAAHPDANQALIDATRQPAFTAVGQFQDYFNEHPQQADELRTIQAPLAAFKDRCGLQVSPTDALAVLADV